MFLNKLPDAINVFSKTADNFAINNHGRFGHQPGALKTFLGNARLLQVAVNEQNPALRKELFRPLAITSTRAGVDGNRLAHDPPVSTFIS